jgi:hypothetical protein
MFKILIYNKKITNNNLKSFGIIWFLIFFAISFYPLIGNNKINMLSLSASIVFFLISIMKPRILKYFYILWIKLGNIIGYYISIIVMFILYFFLFTPISVILKIMRKDLLNKKIDLKTKSYWLVRKVQPNSLWKQF